MTAASGNANGGAGKDDAAGEPAVAPPGHARTVSAVLGEIVWLMSQSPLHKQMFISDLEWMIMPPVLLKQFRLYYQEAPGQTPAASAAVGQRRSHGRPACCCGPACRRRSRRGWRRACRA